MKLAMSLPSRSKGMTLTAFAGLAAFVALATSASAQSLRDGAEPIYLAFTPNGEWLIASYYRAAMNRPGTDWGAWTIEWNTKTWEATRLLDVTMPIAASRDGKWLAMGQYDPRSRRTGPHAKLALWKPGQLKPERVLWPDDAKSALTHASPREESRVPSAVSLDPSSKHLAWIDNTGDLWLNDIAAEKAKPVSLDNLKLNIPPPGWSFPRAGAKLKFADDNRLTLDMTYDPLRDTRGPSRVTWNIDFDRGKAERVEVKPAEPRKPAPQQLSQPEQLKAASPDERWTATARGTDIEIVDRATGGLLKTLSGEPRQR
jgi:hypothetical protein